MSNKATSHSLLTILDDVEVLSLGNVPSLEVEHADLVPELVIIVHKVDFQHQALAQSAKKKPFLCKFTKFRQQMLHSMYTGSDVTSAAGLRYGIERRVSAAGAHDQGPDAWRLHLTLDKVHRRLQSEIEWRLSTIL